MNALTEQELRRREQQMLSEAGFGAIPPSRVYERGWEALRRFFFDLGCHDTVQLVTVLEEAFDARNCEEFS